LGRGGRGKRSEKRYRRGATVNKYHIVHTWGQQFTSWVENTNHELMYFQSIKSVQQNAAKAVNRSTEMKGDI
jgi:hypothetical protein